MKRIIILIILLLFVAACTKVSVTGGAGAVEKQDAKELNISKDGPGYETPSKMVKNLLEEIDIKPFGDVI